MKRTVFTPGTRFLAQGSLCFPCDDQVSGLCNGDPKDRSGGGNENTAFDLAFTSNEMRRAGLFITLSKITQPHGRSFPKRKGDG